MKLLIPLLSSLLLSCTPIREFNRDIPFPEPKPMVIEVRKLEGGNPNIIGTADITGNVCTIHLRKYPQCLAHEVRHCYEGNWHEGEDNDDWCY